MLRALTRQVGPALVDCALTYMDRATIDIERARQQHAAYEAALTESGVRVTSLPASPEWPDAVFVEDAAVVVDEVAVLTMPQLRSRQVEVESVGEALRPFRTVRRLGGDARLEGGDVLRVGRTVYVGRSTRSNAMGAEQLSLHLEHFGYQIHPVTVSGCLHLKTGATFLGDGIVLANPAWVDITAFRDVTVLTVPAEEPWAANCLRIGDRLLVPADAPRTATLLVKHGFSLRPVDIAELAKAEAGLTCCSILYDDRSSA